MRVIVSFQQMVGFGGTETYALTVTGAVERLGHDVLIHTHRAGPCAEFARAYGIRVVDRESELPPECDLVLAQDAATAYTMARRFPDAVRIFVAHSSSFPLQTPPQVEGACQAVVVMNDRLQERAEQLAWRSPVVRLRQPIDLQRFCFRALRLEQRRPPRVLWLTNYAADSRRRMLEQACARAGLELRQVGEATVPSATPEHEIAEAEIVVSLGRGALEAMASGRAAYVFGAVGGDGWVTGDSYPELERDGFSGRALAEPIDQERLASDLANWSEDLGEVGRDLAYRHHSAEEHAVELLALAAELEAPHGPAPAQADELARLVRLEWDRNVQARQAAAETARWRAETATLREQLRDSEARMDAFRETRRYRLASAIGRPLDLLRAGATRRTARWRTPP